MPSPLLFPLKILLFEVLPSKSLPCLNVTPPSWSTKPTYPGSRQWLYYTGADNLASVKLPVQHNGKSCQGDHGCSEIMDGESVSVVGYGSDFKVNLYQLDKPRYLPYVY